MTDRVSIVKNKQTDVPEISKLNFRHIFEITLLILVCGFCLKYFVLNLSMIASNSMLPTLQKGDLVFISRMQWFIGAPGEFSGSSISGFRLWYKTINKGEVIAFKPDAELNKGGFSRNDILVKRVCGIPGDFVVKDNFTYHLSFGQDSRSGNIYKIPGKNTSIELNVSNIEFYRPYIESEGSKVSISEQKIIINGTLANSYKFKHNYYFMAGDNADLSYDSRYFGIVPSTGIVGKPLFILWNKKEGISSFFKSIK